MTREGKRGYCCVQIAAAITNTSAPNNAVCSGGVTLVAETIEVFCLPIM